MSVRELSFNSKGFTGELDCFLVPATIVVEDGRIVALKTNDKTNHKFILQGANPQDVGMITMTNAEFASLCKVYE